MSPVRPEQSLLTADSGEVRLTIQSEYPTYAMESVNSVFLNCALQAPSCRDEERKPVDIVVVLDRSGSMSGSKLELCKKTIEFLIGELSCKDRLSLVTYDTDVRTDMALTRMDFKGKQQTEDMLRNVHAGSATNLSGGLFAGVQEVQSTTRNDQDAPNPVRSVLILTDGLANHGMTQTADIVKMLERTLEPNVSVFTFGYGSDHNADMLRQVSEVGRGVYYFVQNVDGVSLAFADCLGGLLSVVAQNIKLECVALHGCRIKAIKTRKPLRPVVPAEQYEIDMGDLYGDEQRDVLVELTLPAMPCENAEFMVLECRLSYANVLSASFDKRDATVAVQRVSVPNAVPQIPDSHISQQKNRILAAEAIEKATAEAENGRLAEGRGVLEQAVAQVTLQMQYLGESDICATNVLLRDLVECQDNLSTQDQYARRGQHRMKAKVQSHWAQRSNEVEVVQEDLVAQCRPTAAAAAAAAAAPPLSATAIATAIATASATVPAAQCAPPAPPSQSTGYRNQKKAAMLHKACVAATTMTR